MVTVQYREWNSSRLVRRFGEDALHLFHLSLKQGIGVDEIAPQLRSVGGPHLHNQISNLRTRKVEQSPSPLQLSVAAFGFQNEHLLRVWDGLGFEQVLRMGGN